MTVTSAGGDPRDMAALVTISRGMMIGGGPISKIEAHIAASSSGGPREAVYDIALASDKFVTPAIVLRDPQNQRGDDIPGKLVVLVDEDGEETLVDLDALDACPHLLGGGLVEQNVTLATGSGRLVPQIKKSQLGLDTACGMWYTVYITPDGGRA